MPARAKCGIAGLRETLSAADRAELDIALAKRSVTSRAIAAVLKKRGHPISDSSVKRHRRGDCRCQQTA